MSKVNDDTKNQVTASKKPSCSSPSCSMLQNVCQCHEISLKFETFLSRTGGSQVQFFSKAGPMVQMVACFLRMEEVPGSIPGGSSVFFKIF